MFSNIIVQYILMDIQMPIAKIGKTLMVTSFNH